MRIRFLEKVGQRNFLNLVIDKLNAPSLRGLLQFGFDIKYSTLKNYYNEVRLMPEELVKDFCDVADIDFERLEIEKLVDDWGKIKGGKVGKF